MKKLIIITLIGAIFVGGVGALSMVTTKVSTSKVNKTLLTTNQKQQEVAKSEYDTIVDNVKVMQEKLSAGDVSVAEQKEMTTYLLENLPTLIEAHEPQVGDTVEDIGVWLELKQANEQMEQFQLYLDTIDLSKYVPMSSAELGSLIGK